MVELGQWKLDFLERERERERERGGERKRQNDRDHEVAAISPLLRSSTNPFYCEVSFVCSQFRELVFLPEGSTGNGWRYVQHFIKGGSAVCV